HLNWALVSGGKNDAKAENLGLMKFSVLLDFVWMWFTEIVFDFECCGFVLPFQTRMYALKVSFVTLSFQKVFWVLSASFLRRC
ncbi:hypothetical protein, partial [Vibrio genomosp. F6]|uniref:hypothetical protein n=1 Tax=Vibrio genomosp. F6 TaxID=723172 RepID=UPI001A7E05EF